MCTGGVLGDWSTFLRAFSRHPIFTNHLLALCRLIRLAWRWLSGKGLTESLGHPTGSHPPPRFGFSSCTPVLPVPCSRSPYLYLCLAPVIATPVPFPRCPPPPPSCSLQSKSRSRHPRPCAVCASWCAARLTSLTDKTQFFILRRMHTHTYPQEYTHMRTHTASLHRLHGAKGEAQLCVWHKLQGKARVWPCTAARRVVEGRGVNREGGVFGHTPPQHPWRSAQPLAARGAPSDSDLPAIKRSGQQRREE